MPLITESHDSLPYIDPDPTPETRSEITSLLASLLPPTHTHTPHPSLPPLPPPTFSPLILAELARIAAHTPLTAIDLSRYEAPSAPSLSDPPSAWAATLQAAGTSSTYLAMRAQHLGLLERFGAHAWVVGNAGLEGVLARLEAELRGVGGEVEVVNRGRRAGQEAVRGEVEGLERGWREGVGRVVRVEVAGEGVRRRRGGEGGK